MGNVRNLDDHTPHAGMAVEREETTARARLSPSASYASVPNTIELDAPQPRSRERSLPFFRGQRAPAWVVLVVAMLGGGGAGGAATVFGAGDRDMAEVRLEQSTHKARLDAHDIALQEATGDIVSTQRWLADVLVKQSTAIAGVAERVGVKVDVSVPQLISEGR